ncbi:MAG: glutathione S-transferase family protein [Aestuariivita sp.]|nr:glutathione S-transferase family protein [Aestuariivita sp.]
MILHHIPFSRSFRILWMLEEIGRQVDLRVYSIRDGSMRSKELLRCSPAGRVPAIEFDDGSVMFESAAILQVLAETHPEFDLDRPIGHPDRYRFLEILSFAETIGSELEMLNLQHLFLRNPKDMSVSVAKLNTARMKIGLKAVDAMLDGQDWLCRSGFSIADIMMGFNLFCAKYFIDMEQFENLTAYRSRIDERPAYQRACKKDGEQDFYKQDFYPIPNSA